MSDIASSERVPKVAIPPGELVKQIMDLRGLSVADLGFRTRNNGLMTTQRIKQLLEGDGPRMRWLEAKSLGGAVSLKWRLLVRLDEQYQYIKAILAREGKVESTEEFFARHHGRDSSNIPPQRLMRGTGEEAVYVDGRGANPESEQDGHA